MYEVRGQSETFRVAMREIYCQSNIETGAEERFEMLVEGCSEFR